MRVLGIDPGAAHTGFAVVEDGELESEVTFSRAAGDTTSTYVLLTGITLDSWTRLDPPDLIAVEDVVPPKGFRDGKRAPINPGSLIGTAAVLGLVTGFALEHGIRLQVVPPGGNGSGPLGSYPPELVSAAEKRGQGWETRQAGKGALCHVRSAWDVAVVGARMAGVAA